MSAVADRTQVLLFRFWQWYARKVLKIPFVIQYVPPPGQIMLGITFTWSVEYRDTVQNCIVTRQQVADLQEQLQASTAVVAGLQKGDRKSRRIIKNVARKAAKEIMDSKGVAR